MDGRAELRMRDLRGALVAAIEARREELLTYCVNLVEAPSINPPGDTSGPAAIVERFLAAGGLNSRSVAKLASMPNVVTTCEGNWPGPHLVMNVHLDTMEPGDQGAWSVPVDRATRRDGRLYGVGIGNMKGAVAAMSLAFVELARHRAEWGGRLTLAAVADEVIFGEHGAAYLLEQDPTLVGDGLLCGEGPGGLNLGVGEKGLLWVDLEASGDGGHASAVRRDRSAVVRLSRAVLAVDALNGRDVAPPPELSGALPAEHAARRLTANVGLLRAGTVANQIAREASAQVDLRVPPGLALSDLQRAIVAAVAPFDVRVRHVKGWEANWTDPRALLPRCVRQAAERVRGARPDDVVRLPASDASRWRARGAQAVCYGPQLPLSVGVDEYAYDRDIVDCAQVYALAALDFLEANPEQRTEA